MRSAAVDLLVLVPLVGALLLPLAIRWSRNPRLARYLSVGFALAPIGALVTIWSRAASAPVVGRGGALPFWSLSVDGLALPFVALTLFASTVAVLSSWDVVKRPATHHALLLLLQAAVTAVFISADVVLFYVAWEAVLIPLFFLIGGWGYPGASRAAMKFFLFTFTGSVFMLVGLLLAVSEAGTTHLPVLAGALSGSPAETVAFWCIMAGLLVKVPVVGLHTWLPDAHTEAPTAGSIMLAGVVLKLGGYAVLRVALPLAPQAFFDAQTVVAALGIVGIVFGAAMALVQQDLKRLVAYSSISHMGFVVLAQATGTANGYGAAIMVMVSHGLVATLLFYLVGSMSDRTHTRSLEDLGGLGTIAPMWGASFTFAALASLGLPGLSGFPGEFGVIAEATGRYGGWMALVGVGVVLAAAYNLRAVRRVVQGPRGRVGEMADLRALELVVVALLALGILVLGLVPMLAIAPAESVLSAAAAMLGQAR